MADNVPKALVSMPTQPFTLARSFKAAANGKVYIGKVGMDPTIPENQQQVFVGAVPVPQPIAINSGGLPVYNGQVSVFTTAGNHSMLVLDAEGAQQHYFPDISIVDPQSLLALLAGPNGSDYIGTKDGTLTSTIIRLETTANAATLAARDEAVSAKNQASAAADDARSYAQMAALNSSLYADLGAATAAINAGEIPNGSYFFIRATGPALADEYVNSSGTAIPTGRSFLSEESMLQAMSFNLGFARHNLFGGTYQRLGLTDSGTVLGGPLLRSGVVSVKPNTKYIVMRRGELSVFRIAESTSFPVAGAVINVTKPPVEKSSANNSSFDGQPQRWYEFTTRSDSAYALIAVSDNGYDPELFIVQKSESQYLTAVDFKRDLFANDVHARGNITGRNIIAGKNMANPADYIRASVPNSLGDANIITGSTGYSVVVQIQPNTTYTASTDGSDRCRVALSRQDPRIGDLAVRVVFAAENDANNFATFTSGDQECFLTFYFASNKNNLPTIVQVELGSAATALETYGFNIVPPAFNPNNPTLLGKVGFEIGKNIFDGSYLLQASITADSALPSSVRLISNPNARTAAIRIERNTTYTISLPAGDPAAGRRFRVAVAHRVPAMNNDLERVTVIYSNDSATEFTFNSGENNYLFVYSALNGPVPEFMQVEKGPAKTAWERFGYRISNAATPYGSSGGNNDGAGVGNAKYIINKSGVWGAYADANGDIPATDDTEALRSVFSAGEVSGEVSLESHKYYLVSDTFVLNPNSIKRINGKNATLVMLSDKPVLHWLGTLSGSANPIQSGDKIHGEHSFITDSLRICSVDRASGTAVLLEKSLGAIITNCNFYFNSIGVAIKGMNRNIIIGDTHLYANRNYGIHFLPNGDLHQMNVTGTHISYSKINVHSDNHHLYNVQFTGCDIEVSSYPDDVDKSISIKALGDIKVDCVEITGCTLEGHSTDNALVRLEGGDVTSISNVVISGNAIGNGGNAEIQIGGCRNVRIDNVHKFSNGHSIEFIGSTDNINVSGNFHKSKGGIMHCDGDYSLRNVKLFGTVIGGNVTKNPVYIRASYMENISVSMNEIRVNSLVDYNTDNAAIDIGLRPGGAGKLVRVDSNSMALPDGVTKAVVIDSAIVGRSAHGNMNDKGAAVTVE
ncbi:phage tailspike protein [Serratia marcescens]|uniref:phage tailspike protein n=1 Tax=Serratia marcescens TaxID=615 RepID=UPI003878F8FB